MNVAPRALPESLPIGREVEATRLAQLIDDTKAVQDDYSAGPGWAGKRYVVRRAGASAAP